MSTITKVGSMFQATINGKIVKRSKLKHLEYVLRKAGVSEPTVKQEPIKSKFSINERFEFVENLVKMVANETQVSAVITGKGGLGKSHTVTKTLEACGYENISLKEEFTVIPGKKAFRVSKGFATARGLYKMMYENNNAVLVLDDTDSILKNADALNLLKAGLDSYSKRFITWMSDSRDEDIPKCFEYTGRIIFISNMNRDNIDQAIRTRSMMIDLSMTNDEVVDRMQYISNQKEFMPEMPQVYKSDAIQFLREVKDQVKDLSLRTLISVIKIRSSNKEWKKMAEYILE